MNNTKIKKLSTENYKNVAQSCDIRINDLNIFIGPNGSGKSNIIDILYFLRACLVSGQDKEKGGSVFENEIESILGGSHILTGSKDPPDNVTVALSFESPTEERGYRLTFIMRVHDHRKRVSIYSETLSGDIWPEYRQGPFIYYQFHNEQSGKGVVSVKVSDNESRRQTQFEILENVPTNNLALGEIPKLLENSGYPPEKTPAIHARRELVDIISNWRFYNANEMNLNQIRQSEPQIGPTDQFLSSTGENLALVFDNLCQQDFEFEEKINAAMQAVIPTTRKLRAVRLGRLRLTMEWYFEGMKTPLYLSDLSDGTVRMLCWAVILNAPTLPSLLVIDEPELGLHPAWMEALAEWIIAAADRTQVIITTHSPDLLDHFTDHLENVSRFEFDQGNHSVVIQALSRQELASRLDEGWKLGDLYRTGEPGVGGWPW